jgi:hypothetical protein
MSVTSYRPTNAQWLRRLLSGEPHQVIGEDRSDPYLLRWYVVPRNRFLNVYVHEFCRSDDDVPHDHPWWFFSVLIEGEYTEQIANPGDRRVIFRCAPRWSFADQKNERLIGLGRNIFAFRRATHRHRVVLTELDYGRMRHCRTLIVTGRNIRTWGFWCPGQRFVPWQTFTSGAGCGETS